MTALTMDCPVCNHRIPTESFMLHAMMQHPQFFAVWASFSMPTMAPNYELFTQVLDNYEEEEENLSYEALSELCEEIGYHKVGVKNIDEAAPVIHKPPSNDWVCVICLETYTSKMRRICVCDHVFCACCIEQWLKENKTCPVCKAEAEPIKKSTLDDVD